MKRCLMLLLCLFNIVLGYCQSTVEFVVNTDNFVYNENYEQFIQEIVPCIKEHSDDIESVLLIGAASPEGNIVKNTILANKRANKVYSYFSDYIAKNKVVIDNDYDLFLRKTGFSEEDYSKLRATYIEINFKEVESLVDTIYIDNYTEKLDTVYLEEKKNDKLKLSIYNDIVGDLLIRNNIGIEYYFAKMSLFVEGSFSKGYIFDKSYDINLWHAGFRKYFNEDYDKLFLEIYGNLCNFNTDILWENEKSGRFYGAGLGIGYKFKFKYGWKVYPIFRLGFDRLEYSDYQGNINILFGKYVDGKEGLSYEINQIDVNNKTLIDHTGYWFGPTYIGFVIQKDLYF